MQKFHFNSKTGKTGVCSAQIKCRLGIPVDDHYASAEAARKAYEATQETNQVTVFRKNNFSENYETHETSITTSVDDLPRFESKLSPYYLDFCDSPSEMKCPECLTPITQKQVGAILTYGNQTRCAHCYEKFDIDEVEIEINNEFVDIEHDTQNVLKRTWFHSTTRKNWAEGIREKGVGTIHVGSPQAAVDRILSIEELYAPTFVYEIEISNGAVISDDIDPDEVDFKFEENVGRAEFDAVDVSPYMNRWEHPGSVALAVRPEYIRVVGVKSFTLKEAKSILSAYNV